MELRNEFLGVGWRISDHSKSVIMSYCCQKLVDEARDSSGTQKERNIHHWKLLSG
jgi:hypothetical protein